MNQNIEFPVVHLNGTSRNTLLEGYSAASDAIYDAMQKVRKIEFNGRDYYPKGPSSFERARDQFHAALKKLEEAREYFTAISCELYE